MYGLTETTGAITQLDADDHDPDGPRRTCCGRAASRTRGSRCASSTPRRATTSPIGEVGELWTRSPQNMKGYWANPRRPRAPIDADGWFKTGDAGYRDDDGYLYLHDRVKDMIVSGGENIYPAEVENVLMAHPAVADVAVIGVPHERVGRGGQGHRRPRAPAPTRPSRSSSTSAASTSRVQVPEVGRLPEVLPRNPSGKLLKRELRAPYWEGRSRLVN